MNHFGIDSKKVQEFYEVLEEQNAKQQSAEENERREIELLPEAYVEVTEIPTVEATLIEAIPEAILVSENIDFSQFEA